jgi:hypothetical protein
MPTTTVDIPCNFVGDSKFFEQLLLGARLLREFVKANDSGVFNKLIVMEASSMIQSGLAQIIWRAHDFNRELVPNISEADRLATDKGQVDRFKAIIGVMRKYNILDDLGVEIYDELDRLREYWIGATRNDAFALSDNVRDWVLDFNRRILSHLSDHFSRPKDLEQYVAVLKVPSL